MNASATSKIDRQRWMKFFTHLTVILIIFVLPEVLFRASKSHWKVNEGWYFFTYFKTAVYLAVFYLNYFVVANRTLLGPRRRIWLFIGFNLIIIVAALACLYGVQYWSMSENDTPRYLRGNHTRLRFLSFVLRDFAMIALTIGLSTALRLGERWSTLQQRHEQMLASQKSEELQNLKSQLNPHFLFNTLNTIYALIAISPEKAQQAVHELSALLRYVLYENPITVPLSREIGFLKNYIALMEMRLRGDAVRVHFDAGPDPEVAPLVFIVLVENAFKHGNTGSDAHPIEISVTANSEGDIECVTRNHFIAKENSDPDKGGIGVANLRRRLQLLYGDRASLSTSVDGDVYTAVLCIRHERD